MNKFEENLRKEIHKANNNIRGQGIPPWMFIMEAVIELEKRISKLEKNNETSND